MICRICNHSKDYHASANNFVFEDYCGLCLIEDSFELSPKHKFEDNIAYLERQYNERTSL